MLWDSIAKLSKSASEKEMHTRLSSVIFALGVDKDHWPFMYTCQYGMTCFCN